MALIRDSLCKKKMRISRLKVLDALEDSSNHLLCKRGFIAIWLSNYVKKIMPRLEYTIGMKWRRFEDDNDTVLNYYSTDSTQFSRFFEWKCAVVLRQLAIDKLVHFLSLPPTRRIKLEDSGYQNRLPSGHNEIHFSLNDRPLSIGKCGMFSTATRARQTESP